MRTCAMCSEPIPDTAISTQKYCSEACIRLSRSRHPASQARNAGSSTAHRIRSYAIQEQGCACILCGWSIPGDKSYGLEVHHIIEVADGGTYARENLAVLCPNHHKLAGKRRIAEAELRKAWSEAVEKHKGFDPAWVRLQPAIERLDALRTKLRAELPASPKRRKTRTA